MTRKRVLGLILCAALVMIVIGASLGLGARDVSLAGVFNALFGFDGSTDQLVIRELRVPRTLLGLLVGAALGVAGALMQGITRNPLADPGLLGVSAGAALAVVVGITFFGISSVSDYVWLAFVGAAVVSMLVYALGSMGRGGATPVRLTLAGAALASLLASFTSAMILLNLETLNEFRFWVVGSLAGRSLEVLAQVTPFIIGGLVLSLFLAAPLNALALGDETARSLGTRVGWTRAGSALAITLLCGAATAACGPIVFIGLVIPHLARRFCGPDQRWLMPYSALLGAIVLLGCDILSRVVARPAEIQVGITTAAVGGIAFVILVRQTRLAQL
jgi:iron complex transport system permease protein